VLEGLYFPDEMSVDPERMVHRLLAFMQEKFSGFVYKNDCTATTVETTDKNARLITSGGEEFTSEKIIICNGSEFRILFPELYTQSGLIVSKLQMLRTIPMPEIALPGNILTGLSIRRYESFTQCPSFASLNTPDHYTELKKWGIHILFKQAEDGSIIIGDSHEYAPAATWESLGYDIQEHINALILQEAQRIVTFDVNKIAKSWAGYYSQHPQEIFTDTIDNKIFIFTGIGGKGMTSSAGFAEENIATIFN
jgi:FAD dependent oxidoreductase TIGR03364